MPHLQRKQRNSRYSTSDNSFNVLLCGRNILMSSGVVCSTNFHEVVIVVSQQYYVLHIATYLVVFAA